jgi:UPF0755 protein
MNDFLPPKRPLSAQRTPERPVTDAAKKPTPPLLEKGAEEPLLESPHQPLLTGKSKRSAKKIIAWAVVGMLAVLMIIIAAAVWWYNDALRPVAGETAEAIQVEIPDGSTPTQIGQLLEEKQLVRSGVAFDIYTRLSGARSNLQAGLYTLAPSESTQQIVEHLTSGNIDQFSITFLPGATLAENRDGLIRSGFSEEEVDAALSKTYDSPLFANKPAMADLEGYIYGETYNFPAGTSVEEVLQATFAQFYTVLTENNLVDAFAQQGLNLYEAITLASIIQREVPDPNDQKQVAQIFYLRLSKDMPLGSDVTAYYGADLIGVERSVAVDTPYNTRIHSGLPPGPIATPGFTALEAVADPATGDYLYFLSGDDDETYFSRTSEEHDQNAVDHCQLKCSIP